MSDRNHKEFMRLTDYLKGASEREPTAENKAEWTRAVERMRVLLRG